MIILKKYVGLLGALGSISSILALYLTILSNPDDAFLRSFPGIIVIIALILLVLILITSIFIIVTYHEVDFAKDFSSYCDKCKKMVKNSSGRIMTVQTPQEPTGDHKTAFEEYIQSTVLRLIKIRRNRAIIKEYRRLVIVDENSIESESKKMRIFLNELFKAGNSSKDIVTYDNIKIAIVNKFFASIFYYSNLDIHITSDKDYAIAFAQRNGDKYHWSSSLHVFPFFKLEIANANIKTLEKSFEALWGHGDEFNFFNDYEQDNQDHLAEQNSLKNKIISKMEEIAKKKYAIVETKN